LKSEPPPFLSGVDFPPAAFSGEDDVLKTIFANSSEIILNLWANLVRTHWQVGESS
jgi:hypothetical protein